MNGNNLTERERYVLESYLKIGMRKPEIAKRMGICLATVYNEIKRGSVELLNSDYTTRIEYCADRGQAVTMENQKNKGACLKAKYNSDLLNFIGELIVNQKYSPYAVSVVLAQNTERYGMVLSEKTIYNYVYRGLIPNTKKSNLPYRKKSQKNKSVRSRISLNNILGRSIEERPDFINERETVGHWEMDTVVSGQKKSKECLLVLTERKTREEEIYKMPDKCAKSTVAILNGIEISMGADAFRKRYLSITSDNGVEFLDSDGISLSCVDGKPRTNYYYCHPYCSSERGSNENNNKLIRRWIPKGSDMSQYSDEEIHVIANWCNDYPRKIFGGLSVRQHNEQIQAWQ